MTELTAIDVLIDPDAAAIAGARAVNARVLQSMPGWVLDETYMPHITMLQRYVRTADLDKVYGAVQSLIEATDMASLSFRAARITHADWGFPGYGTHGAPRRGRRQRPRLSGGSGRGRRTSPVP